MPEPGVPNPKPWPAWTFWLPAAGIAGCYVVLILALLVADAAYAPPGSMLAALAEPDIQFSIKLSLVTCALTAILSVWVAVPTGYLLARWQPRTRITRWLRALVDAVVDIPIVLPPLVVGISLLILFRTGPGQWIESNITRFTYEVAGLVLAQFTVAAAFAIRAMRSSFEHLSPRPERVARTLGASQQQVFWSVAVPSSRRGIVSAATVAWARSMGEFGPVLVFAGATRHKTEVLPTTVFLELSVGNLKNAVAVSLLMVIMSVAVLVLVRFFGDRGELHDRV